MAHGLLPDAHASGIPDLPERIVSMDHSQVDRHLCERLIQQDAAAVDGFRDRFAAQLKLAISTNFSRMPRWTGKKADFIGPVAGRVATAYLNAANRERQNFDGFVQNLCLADMILVETCLQGDAAASRFLIRICETHVKPGLLRSWGGRVGLDHVEDVVQDLCSHCFTLATKGKSAGAVRMESYRGRASLSTWLHAVAVKLLMDRVRASRGKSLTSEISDSLSSPAISQPEIQAQIGEAASRGDDFRTRLLLLVRTVMDAMPARRRLAAVLHWVNGHKSSEVADRMQVSRPRVTELLSEAELDVKNATRRLCEEIAAASDRSVNDIEILLTEQLPQLLGEPASR